MISPISRFFRTVNQRTLPAASLNMNLAERMARTLDGLVFFLFGALSGLVIVQSISQAVSLLSRSAASPLAAGKPWRTRLTALGGGSFLSILAWASTLPPPIENATKTTSRRREVHIDSIAVSPGSPLNGLLTMV